MHNHGRPLYQISESDFWDTDYETWMNGKTLIKAELSP